MADLTPVELSIVDKAMDTHGQFDVGVNTLPSKCEHCTFPDLDFVPEPYALARGLDSSKEIEVLSLGDLVVRPRVRKILADAVGDQVSFHPTCHWKTREPTEWTLVVPRALRPNLSYTPRASMPRCPKCGEPRTAHFSQLVETGVSDPPMTADICKSQLWLSYEQTGEEATHYWMHVMKLKQRPKPREAVWTRIDILRWAFVSLRLYTLLRELKVIGLIPTGSEPRERPTSDDRDWIVRKLEIFAAAGARPSKPTGKQRDWFKAYLASHKGKGVLESQIAGAEKRLGLALPASYRQFMNRLGKRKFRNIEEEPGFDVTIVPPKDLDHSGDWLRDSQQPPADNGEPTKTLLFGTTGFGDCFVFDISHGLIDGEYPVFIYRHESDEYEPYADSFGMCIKRFVGHSD